MRMRPFSNMLMLTGVFVSAGLNVSGIMRILKFRYADGDHVDPEGPLNIMRGHSCINNGMIAKQRKYAAPMRLGYSRTGDARKGNCAYTRNAAEDEIWGASADSEAMGYLSEHYRVLKSMFTVENDVVAVNKSRRAPFCDLFKSEQEKCVTLLAALLVLAGGGDIRLDFNNWCYNDKGKRVVSLVAYDGDMPSHVLDLEVSDSSATLAVVEFVAKYGGVNAGQVARYGLHYTDSPSFLIQAYICEFIGSQYVLERIIKVAKGIVAKLAASDSGAQDGPRFFTKDENYVRAYTARYDALCIVEEAFGGEQHDLLRRWQSLNHENYSSGDDSKGIVSALLKLCCCLYLNTAAVSYNPALLSESHNRLQRAFGDFASSACAAATLSTGSYSWSEKNWESVTESYEKFLEVARTKAAVSETITGCCGKNITAGLATDPGYFLLVLAWVLGEPEEKLQSLQDLLHGAFNATDSTFDCQQISDRVSRLLTRFSAAPVKASFNTFTTSNGARCGSLRLEFHLRGIKSIWSDYAVKLIFTPEKVKIVHLSGRVRLNDVRRRAFVSTPGRIDMPRNPGLLASAHEELDKLNNFPLCALIRKSIMRCLYPNAHRAISDMYIADVSAAEGPLACHIALSHWMANQPMQTLSEAVAAADQLIPVFEKLLAQSADGSDPRQCALAANHPVVAVLDNILGSAAVVDDALHELCTGILRHCVNNRIDFSQSLFLPTDRCQRNAQERDRFAHDSLLACLDEYDMPEMLLRHAERRIGFETDQ
ncbi:hypothetical protein PAPHI01_0464 [Pancytospora philotis]|nr:hypothetical protein PAPHI01_0464 [Pancytospora philotis]